MGFNAAIEYPNVKDCFQQEKQINVIKSDIAYFRERFDTSAADAREKVLKAKEEQFQVSGCSAVVEAKRQADSKVIYDKYAGIANIRITADSFKTRYVYLAFGALTLIVATVIIIRNRK